MFGLHRQALRDWQSGCNGRNAPRSGVLSIGQIEFDRVLREATLQRFHIGVIQSSGQEEADCGSQCRRAQHQGIRQRSP